MAADENLIVGVLMDLQERVKYLERCMVRTKRPIVNDEMTDPDIPGLPIDVPAAVPREATPFTTKQVGLPKGSVRRHCTIEDQKLFVRMLETGRKPNEIARLTHWSPQTILNQLRKAGIVMKIHYNDEPIDSDIPLADRMNGTEKVE